jgi:hypothetical protein
MFCNVCSKEFHAVGNVRYCSDACRKIVKQQKNQQHVPQEQQNIYSQRWAKKNPDKKRMGRLSYRMRLRLETLAHYSKSEQPKCCVCGYSNPDALVLDHINNDGAKHRESLKVARRGGGTDGISIQEKLHAQGFPDVGLQVLCCNCNTIKQAELTRESHRKNPFYGQYIINDQRIWWVTK